MRRRKIRRMLSKTSFYENCTKEFVKQTTISLPFVPVVTQLHKTVMTEHTFIFSTSLISTSAIASSNAASSRIVQRQQSHLHLQWRFVRFPHQTIPLLRPPSPLCIICQFFFYDLPPGHSQVVSPPFESLQALARLLLVTLSIVSLSAFLYPHFSK